MKCKMAGCSKTGGSSGYCEVHSEIMKIYDKGGYECVEEGCNQQADMKLFGLRLCKDHYDKYESLFKKSADKENVECEEPHCTSRATIKYRGRNICSDHYDQYNSQDAERRGELDK